MALTSRDIQVLKALIRKAGGVKALREQLQREHSKDSRQAFYDAVKSLGAATVSDWTALSAVPFDREVEINDVLSDIDSAVQTKDEASLFAALYLLYKLESAFRGRI